MPFLTENRAALRRRFYALTGTSSTDDALTEHDGEANEQLHYYVQHGVWRAQRWLIDHGYADGWLTTSGALSFSGTETTDGGKYWSLPADFLRLAGDDTVARSALRQPDGTRWGQYVEDERDLYNRRGDFYTIRGGGGNSAGTTGKLWVAVSAAPPSDLVLDYHHRHAVLSDDVTALDFPQDVGMLCVAEAAAMAMDEAWLPGGGEMREKIDHALQMARQQAEQWTGRARMPKRLHARPAWNGRWI